MGRLVMRLVPFIGTLLISVFICGSVTAISILLFAADIPASAEKFAILVFGGLMTAFGQMTQFWFGTSAEGAAKDRSLQVIAEQQSSTAATVATAAANAPPPTPTPPPTAPPYENLRT